MKIVVSMPKGGSGKSTLTLALADVLPDVQIVDLDPQGTISRGARYSKRHTPIREKEATGQYIIYDTPPYRTETSKSYLETADLVLIPVRASFADLLAVQAILDDLKLVKMTHKAVIVFNSNRKPVSQAYREAKSAFSLNYPNIKKATTELSQLMSFHRILVAPVKGQARMEIINLIKELNIDYGSSI